MKFGQWRMRTQVVILVVVAFVTGQLLSLWLFADERSLAVQAALGAEAAGRAANVARLIETAPPDLHDEIVQAASSPLVRFEIGVNARVEDGEHHGDATVAARIRALMGDSFSRAIRVKVQEVEGIVLPVPNLTPDMAQLHADMMRGTLVAVELEISIALSGGGWLNVATRFERPPWQISVGSITSFVLSAGLVVVAVFWFVIARLTGPLTALTRATERLGRGDEVPELSPTGPREVRALTEAFNTMQDRLSRFVSDRTLMLAALAHDLRSPLTAMRVQTELIDDPETRAALGRTTDEMSSMVEATLAYARGIGAQEEMRPAGLADLVRRSAVDSDVVTVASEDDIEVVVRQKAMIRALRNLIENANRYGGCARISWARDGETVTITIDDDGPGIPENQLEHVFEPYVRLEQSRSRETGGTGLGLSIARSIILTHGGLLTLSNLPEGGLRACIKLPHFLVASEQDSVDAGQAKHRVEPQPTRS